jgi:7-cyano-7-deazaguanine synthase
MNKALVILSGGLDSTTALLWATREFDYCEAVFFDYGQKHIVEKECATKISKLANVPLTILTTDIFTQIGGSSLTDHSIEMVQTDGVKTTNTFVPGRNIVFISLAAALASVKGITNLVTGIRYAPAFLDCTEDTLHPLQETINNGIGKITIHHPIFERNREETVRLAQELDALDYIGHSVSCYNGYPSCGECKPCKDRAYGFSKVGIEDPQLSNSWIKERNT